MNNDDINIELFEKYHSRLMDKKEEKLFRERLNEDKDFKIRFIAFKNAVGEINSYSRSESKKYLKSLFSKKKNAKKNLGEFLQNLFNEFFMPYDDLITVRDTKAGNDHLKKGAYYYNKSDFGRAGNYFKKHLLKDPDDLLCRFYLAISELHQNKLKSSLKHFTEIEKKNNIFFKDIVRWYKGLLYIRHNSPDLALQEFKSITPDLKSFPVREIIQKLSGLDT